MVSVISTVFNYATRLKSENMGESMSRSVRDVCLQALPTPSFAPEVKRGSIPGAPNGTEFPGVRVLREVIISVPFPVDVNRWRGRAAERDRFPIDSAAFRRRPAIVPLHPAEG